MAITQAEVNNLANAYRAAMSAGDQNLKLEPVERKILQAVVADSAASTLSWIQTRSPDGNEVGKPLENLVPALKQGNIVGGTLQSVKDKATSEAKSAVYGLVFSGTTPIWLGALGTAAAGYIGWAELAGETVGTVLIPLLLGGGAAVGAVVRGIQMSGRMLEGTGQAAGTVWDAAGNIGASAEAVFRANVTAPLQAVTGSGPAVPVLATLRGAARTVVALAFVALAVGVLYFLGGLSNAWTEYNSCVRGSDGQCLDLDGSDTGFP